MNGKATIAWGGALGGGVIAGDVTLDNGMHFTITAVMGGVVLGAQGNTLASHVEFDPAEVKNGNYFTSIAGAAGGAGGTAISFAHHVFGKQIGSITFSGLGAGVALGVGNSEFKVD